MVAATTTTTLNCGGLLITPGELVSALTAARVSGFSVSWVYKLIDRGDLWSVDIDGHTYVRKVDATRLKRGKPGRPKKAASASS